MNMPPPTKIQPRPPHPTVIDMDWDAPREWINFCLKIRELNKTEARMNEKKIPNPIWFILFEKGFKQGDTMDPEISRSKTQ